ncbi:hypothetical protein EDB85DRAFT_1898279 [Lactarius pseudohatsudake]|nr:hypothetical protein EDB85DRAFT_1898279 [Lactarius pseudohatsudake]
MVLRLGAVHLSSDCPFRAVSTTHKHFLEVTKVIGNNTKTVGAPAALSRSGGETCLSAGTPLSPASFGLGFGLLEEPNRGDMPAAGFDEGLLYDRGTPAPARRLESVKSVNHSGPAPSLGTYESTTAANIFVHHGEHFTVSYAEPRRVIIATVPESDCEYQRINEPRVFLSDSAILKNETWGRGELRSVFQEQVVPSYGE